MALFNTTVLPSSPYPYVPYRIYQEWCMGDSLDVINANFNHFDASITELQTKAVLLSATVNSLIIPGAVMSFAMNAAPAGWLVADGATVSRTTYAALFTAIGTLYGAGNGSTTFTLPDLRGYFVRGSGTNSDGTASGAFGVKQASYGGNFTVTGTPGPGAPTGAALAGGGYEGAAVVTAVASNGSVTKQTGTIVTDYLQFNGGSTLANAVTETQTVEIPYGDHRPRNIAMLYCIKF